VERSLQRNEQVRFDLFVLMESVATIQQRLHAFARRWSWHIRNHVPFELRGLAPPARTPPAPPPRPLSTAANTSVLAPSTSTA
jgi:hypothetical protein